MRKYNGLDMLRLLRNILVVLTLLTIFGCKRNTSYSVLSNVAQITSFRFASQDSIPGLGEAVFKIEELIDTGLIYTADSVRYRTPLDKVVPKYTFAATPYAAFLHFKDTVIRLTGIDTVDFTKTPCYMSVVSGDQTKTKYYRILITQHQVDPDSVAWRQLTSEIYPETSALQQAFWFNGSFQLFTGDGSLVNRYTSSDARLWTKQNISGLPASSRVRYMVVADNVLCCVENNMLWTSADGETWTSYTITPDYDLQLALFAIGDYLCVVGENKTDNTLALLSLLPPTWAVDTVINVPDAFPVQDFAAVTFNSISLRQRAMLIGGISKTGAKLNSRWNFEYYKYGADRTIRMKNFAGTNSSFEPLSGASAFWYGGQLYMLGGVKEDNTYVGRHLLVSKDEGITWVKVDTAQNMLPEQYTPRQRQTVLVHNSHLFVIGGHDDSHFYSDVYDGYLQSIDWVK